jgi:hypothetical protein
MAVNPIQVQKFLKGVNYPCSKADIISTAQREGADANVVSTLKRMNRNEFNSPNDVAQALGQIE